MTPGTLNRNTRVRPNAIKTTETADIGPSCVRQQCSATDNLVDGVTISVDQPSLHTDKGTQYHAILHTKKKDYFILYFRYISLLIYCWIMTIGTPNTSTRVYRNRKKTRPESDAPARRLR